MTMTAALIPPTRFNETRERVQSAYEAERRPAVIAAETMRLERRRRTPVLELLDEDEIFRLRKAAPGLMRDLGTFRKD